MIYQTKSTEFGEFCRIFFENLKFGQILSENPNLDDRKAPKFPNFAHFAQDR
jgi:hypothetical protein